MLARIGRELICVKVGRKVVESWGGKVLKLKTLIG